jgi:hypothetical protein
MTLDQAPAVEDKPDCTPIALPGEFVIFQFTLSTRAKTLKVFQTFRVFFSPGHPQKWPIRKRKPYIGWRK